MKKSQTSTEYLIILAVVIIIAIIVISLLGGIPSISGNTNQKISKSNNLNLKIGIIDYKHNSHSTLLKFINNEPFKIMINDMWINTKKCNLYPYNSILKQGEIKYITCYGVVGLNEGDFFDYDFNITYTDLNLGAKYVINSNLIGRIALGSELHTGQSDICYKLNDGNSGQTKIDCSDLNAGGDAIYDGIKKSFINLGDNVLKDFHTGLYWTNNIISASSIHSQATSDCDSLIQGGYNDWRLPNIVELVSAMNSNKLQQGISSNWVVGDYWSSTKDPDNPSNYLYLKINSGYFLVYNKDQSNSNSVVCVRGNMVDINLIDGIIYNKDFVMFNDEIVIDKKTGLVWEKYSSPSTMSWNDSLNYCESKIISGYDDWRLPNILELYTILDFSCTGPSDANCIGNYASDFFYNNSDEDRSFWSSTLPVSSDNHAYFILPDGGGFNINRGMKFNPFYVRCVRNY